MRYFLGLACAVLIWMQATSHAQNRAAAEALFERAVFHFEQGQVVEAAQEFDKVADLAPEEAPHLWQRGIALYYAGRYEDCRTQFESHRIVNPNDVENAVWHFLCVARVESPAAAREALLPVGPDRRVPMRQVYQMFDGSVAPVQVLNAAGESRSGKFFAHLYLGLYFESQGQDQKALKHIKLAAASRYARAGGYMHMVATVHLKLLEKR